MFNVYILYSNLKDSYYVGYTSMELDERIRRHLSSHKGYTGKVKDWKIIYFESYIDKKLAILREQEIKKWKSKIKIKELISKK